MTTIRTRMGDGHAVEMTVDQIRADVSARTEDAAERGRIPALTEQEWDRLVELFCRPDRVVSVEQGHEVVLTELREELDIGVITSVPGASKGLVAKTRIGRRQT